MARRSRKAPAVTRKLKVRLWRHLGQRCFYCEKHVPIEKVTIDHVFPRVEGYHSINNVVPSCKPCNGDKGRDWPDLDLIMKVQVLYDAAGERFDPFMKGQIGESVLSFWGQYCNEHRDPEQSETG